MFVTTLLGDCTVRAIVLKLNAGLESLIDNMSIEIFFTFLHQSTGNLGGKGFDFLDMGWF